MNQASGNVENEAEEPQNQEYSNNRTEHADKSFSVVIGLAILRMETTPGFRIIKPQAGGPQ
jgi:hypothetical protein